MVIGLPLIRSSKLDKASEIGMPVDCLVHTSWRSKVFRMLYRNYNIIFHGCDAMTYCSSPEDGVVLSAATLDRLAEKIGDTAYRGIPSKG